MQPDAIYADTRRRLADFVRTLEPARLATPVPACPGWTVHGVIAHLAGLAADIAGGRLTGFPSDEWTAGQVAARAGRSVEELLAEWDEHAPAVEAVIAAQTGIVSLAVDVATHEHDVRAALGEPPVEQSAGFDYALQAFVMGMGYRLRKRGLPALQLRSGDQEWTLGEGDVAATVAAPAAVLLRAVSGRRSAAQVRALTWDGDPDPYLALFGPFGGLPAEDVVEPAAVPST